MIKKLAIITTHPIQYYAPIFQLMAKEIDLKVFYTWGKTSINKFDTGFKKQVEWDLPLLDGYDSMFVENIAKNQGTHHFNGINNPTLIQLIQIFNPDAVLVYGWAWKSHLNAIRYFKGKMPIYFRGDSTLLNKQKSFKRLLRKCFLKWVYSHIDKAFYVGTANKAYFKAFALKEEQLVFAPHAIDNDRFAECKSIEARSLRVTLGVDANEILILFAGKFDSIKNPGILLDAILGLDLKHVHLLFVGNGILEWDLKLKVELLVTGVEGGAKADSFDHDQDDEPRDTLACNIKRRIHFIGFQNQTAMPAVYQACDLFCLPSLSETWGLAVNEAMACSKAVLVSDQVGCAVDLVKQNVNGCTFKAGDLVDLQQKLKTLTENKEKLVQMGLASQQIIRDWSFEKQVKVIVDTIQNEYAK